MAILISDKAKAEIDLFKRDREGKYILIKGSINSEEIAVLNMYEPNVKAFYSKRQTGRTQDGDR